MSSEGAAVTIYPLNDDGSLQYTSGLALNRPSRHGRDRARAVADHLVLQAGPLEEFAYETVFEHTDYMTVSGGEFSRPLGKKLRTVSFDTLLAPGDYSWKTTARPLVDLVRSVEAQLSWLERLAQTGQPFLMTVTPVGADLGLRGDPTESLLSMRATIRSLRVNEKAGEPDTKYLTLQCVEYEVPVLTSGTGSTRPPRRAAKHTLSLDYNPKKKRWKIVIVAPRNSPAAKEVRQLVKKNRVTIAGLAKAIYGSDYQRQLPKVIRANKSILGKKWRSGTRLEKATKFKSGKRHRLVFPAES